MKSENEATSENEDNAFKEELIEELMPLYMDDPEAAQDEAFRRIFDRHKESK